jgi:hypothetical protein
MPVPLKVYKNRDFCGAEVPNESFLVGAGGSLQNVVIIIQGAHGEKIENPSRSLILDNKRCALPVSALRHFLTSVFLPGGR